MAGGPIFPSSLFPATGGRTFHSVYVGTGAGGASRTEGMGLEASVGADSTWQLQFDLPPALPTGTLKLRLLSISSAATGNLKFDVLWNKIGVSADPSAITLINEGSTQITWGAGSVGKLLESKVTLDATAAAASDILPVNLTFLTSGATVASVTIHRASLIWE